MLTNIMITLDLYYLYITQTVFVDEALVADSEKNWNSLAYQIACITDTTYFTVRADR